MEVKICTNEVLLNLLFRLMQVQNRKCVTASEVERFQEYIKREAKKQGVDVTFIYDMTERLSLIRKYIDTIIVDGKVVYRLNYSVTTDEVRELMALLDFYQKQHIDIACENDDDFMATLNDFTEESEKECEIFKIIDEKRQLEIIYQLFELEKKKRKLNISLNMMVFNQAYMIDDVAAEALLEQNPNITKSEFITKMNR